MGTFDKIPEGEVGLAVVATNVQNVKETVSRIEGRIDTFITKVEVQTKEFIDSVSSCRTRLDATEREIRGVHKRIAEVSSGADNDMNVHELNCPARAVLVQQVANKASRVPKPTPKEIKQPLELTGGIVIPAWIYWLGAIIGVAVVSALITYQQFGGVIKP